MLALIAWIFPRLTASKTGIDSASGPRPSIYGGIKGEKSSPPIADLVSIFTNTFLRQLTRKFQGESSEELLRAVGEREIMWLRRFGERRYPGEPLYREFYSRQKVDPQVQIIHLSDYLKVTPHLAPQEKELNIPTIRHPDLSPTNIFISDAGDITGIIDWQHTTILPIFLQAKIPKHFQNYGDEDSENLRRPQLAENFATMNDSD